jgi:hypothetical protein
MADQVTKIVFRRGTDILRRTANTTGVVFDIGEPGYVTDTQRLYIGNGRAGGVPIGVKNFGIVDTLFGTYLGSNFSPQAYALLSAADVGDLIYERATTSIYSLSSRSNFSTSICPLSTDFYKFDLQTKINTTQFYYDGLNLTLKDQGITPSKLAFTNVDNLTITKPSLTDPFQLKPGDGSGSGIQDFHFSYIGPNSLYLNSAATNYYPRAVSVLPYQLVGRTSVSSPLTALSFSTVFQNAPIFGSNGVAINNTGTSVAISLSSNVFNATQGGLAVLQPLTVNNAASFTSSVTITGNTVVAGTLSARGNTAFGGYIVVDGAAYIKGDVIAFFTSDVSLKKNIKKIESPLSKLSKISGYTYDWKQSEFEHLKGHDIGVIAQEVEQTIPEAVTERSTGHKAVNYQKLIPLLIEAVKELDKKIENK